MTGTEFVRLESEVESVRVACGQIRRKVGASVARARREVGWSRGDLGRRMGVSSARGLTRFGERLAVVERGQRLVTPDELEHWGRFLPFDQDQMLGELQAVKAHAARLVELDSQKRTFWIEDLVASIQSSKAQSSAWEQELVFATGFFLLAGPLQFGTGRLQRRQLIELWQTEDGCWTCPTCRGRLGLYFGARSLSRFHRLTGICLDDSCGVSDPVSKESKAEAKARVGAILKRLLPQKTPI